MTTYKSNKVAATIPARALGPTTTMQACSYTVSTALANNDVIQLFTIPAGAVITYLVVSSDGTGSGSNSTFEVGDGDDTDRYLLSTGGTALRSGGGTNQCTRHNGIGYAYTAEDTIDLKVIEQGVGSTTGGVIRAVVHYCPQA